jgi:hypothetical protein
VSVITLIFFVVVGGFIAACFGIGAVLKHRARRTAMRNGGPAYGWPGEPGPSGPYGGGSHHGGHPGGFGGGGHHGGGGGGHHGGGGGGGDHGGGGGGHHG